MKTFDANNQSLRNQFQNVNWIKESGLDENELGVLYEDFMKNGSGENRALLKAKLFSLICSKSQIAIDKDDIFQDKIFYTNFLYSQRRTWRRETIKRFLEKERAELDVAYKHGACDADVDFGHTSPNSALLLRVGFQGLLRRIEQTEKIKGLSQKQKEFYESCKITLDACVTFALRLADAVSPYDAENEKALRQIALGAPTNTYEAMQLLIVYFFLHEYVLKTRVRTLGRLDVLLYPFYKTDIESGKYTKAEIKEMLKFFLNKFSAASDEFGLPFCLSGLDESGNDVTSELTYLIVETYQELNIYNPKIHIRVSSKTPKDLIILVLKSIRNGQSSFVFCNDDVAIRALSSVGIRKEDAMNYAPIGCYEPAVWGKELGCTYNGGVNLAKAVEFAFSGGVDTKDGVQIGAKTQTPKTFDEFYNAVKTQIAFMTEKCLHYIREVEKHYGEIGPDPLLSCMYDDSVSRGIDVYEGGATYNNSSLCFFGIATLIDSLTAIKKFVYDKKRLSLSEFYDILKDNWKPNPKLRLQILKMKEKYGNEDEFADALTKDATDYCASLVNNVKNGRGGVFKASLFTINYCFTYGKNTMATPDGRQYGDSVSKNLCASFGMDKNGVLSLIHSVTKIDHAKFPNGSVLDVILHPSAVQGEEGIEAFYGILTTYFAKGGYAMHGNVFLLEDLMKAQKHPEKYATLQVRLCGWNAYFVSLKKEEQDSFIKQLQND